MIDLNLSEKSGCDWSSLDWRCYCKAFIRSRRRRRILRPQRRCSIRIIELLEGAGSVSGIVADMGDKNSTEAFISDVLVSGDVDLLINNVGASPSRNFLYMKDEDWTELHELNRMSAVRCTRAFLPAMRKKNGAEF